MEHPVTDVAIELNIAAEPPQAVQPRRQGRLAGIKNKLRTYAQYLVQYLIKKEEEDFALTIKLRNNGVINILGALFKVFNQKEVDNLISYSVFSFKLFNLYKSSAHRIFKSQLIYKVKGKTIVLYKKSQLIIQGYNNVDKHKILTQLLIIQ